MNVAKCNFQVRLIIGVHLQLGNSGHSLDWRRGFFTLRAFEIIDKSALLYQVGSIQATEIVAAAPNGETSFSCEVTDKLSALLLEHSDHKFIPPPDSAAANKSLRLPPKTKWEELSHFYGRPVFEQIWIIREVCVVASVTVVCGSYQIDWSKVANAAIILDNKKWVKA